MGFPAGLVNAGLTAPTPFHLVIGQRCNCHFTQENETGMFGRGRGVRLKTPTVRGQPMKTVFVLFDSLNRHALGCYGGSRVATPNFDRLAERSVVHDKHYAGSLPCMPARRDLLTGRLNFLHRSWGPLEPFDNAFPETLRENGVYSHLATDHYHYWEDGGATYHNRYSSYDFIRGQECDGWKALMEPEVAKLREKYHYLKSRDSYDKPGGAGSSARNFDAYLINREFIREEQDFPAVQTFARGLEFLDRNRDGDDWLLQIETFDPHEPFYAPARFKQRFDTGWDGAILDWPKYGRVEDTPEEAAELRANYDALVAMCDHLLGQLLDYFDRYDLWRDTALIVSTDHGFLLGEHDFWAKIRMHLYNEICHIPLFIFDPRAPKTGRCDRLTQSIDIAPTVLDLHGVQPPPQTMGHSLLRENDRRAILYGYFGGAVNVTDGRYTYHRFPQDIAAQKIYQYTVMATHIRSRFSTEELSAATLAAPFDWTKNVPTLKVPVTERSPMYNVYGPGTLIETDTRLYDLAHDPGQNTPIHDPHIEATMVALMRDLMAANDAPPEAFDRLDLPRPERDVH